MSKYTIVIDERTYNKTSLLAECRRIVRENKGGADLLQHDKSIAAWVYEQRRGEKPAASVRFRVGDYGAYSGFIYTHDDWLTHENMSFKKALMTNEGESKHKILNAFRWAIAGQIREFRVQQLNLPRNRHLKELAAKDCQSVHTDHIIPMHQLLSDFLQERALVITDVQVRERGNKTGEYEIVDKRLEVAWQSFHAQHAKLQLLSASENYSKAGTYDLALYRYNRSRQRSYDFKTTP